MTIFLFCYRSIDMKVKAMSDCASLVKSSPIEMTHHKYVRAEAALALARWQGENAPKDTSHGDITDDNFIRSWKGKILLFTNQFLNFPPFNLWYYYHCVFIVTFVFCFVFSPGQLIRYQVYMHLLGFHAIYSWKI